MHNEGYCYRYLKTEKLLVMGHINSQNKIVDLGLATIQLNGPLESYVLTRPYRAPERF